jgi:hypothetical protein
MTNTEIIIMGLWLRLRDFYRRHKFAIFLLMTTAGVVVFWILLSRGKGEASLSVGPEWGEWNPHG